MFSNFVVVIVFAFVVAFVGSGAGLGLNGPTVNSRVNANNNGYAKEQCKDGGWRELGFRNQGQCVAFFASGGRAPGF